MQAPGASKFKMENFQAEIALQMKVRGTVRVWQKNEDGSRKGMVVPDMVKDKWPTCPDGQGVNGGTFKKRMVGGVEDSTGPGEQSKAPYKMYTFEIFGKGAGDARIGKLKGKWSCSKSFKLREDKENPWYNSCWDGDTKKIPQQCKLEPNKVDGEPRLPMSWAVLAPTFAYGYKVYAHYPKTEIQFFQECMPGGGYKQNRVTRFGRMKGDDTVAQEGEMHTSHDVVLREGVVKGELTWIIHNTVMLEADIWEGSTLLDNHGQDIFLQSLERTVPCDDGVKNYVQYFYPIKGSEGDKIIATQMTHNFPLNPPMATSKRVVPLPKAHFKRTECKQWREEGEKRDHVMQDEINQYFMFENNEPWNSIEGGVEETPYPDIDKMSVSDLANRTKNTPVMPTMSDAILETYRKDDA